MEFDEQEEHEEEMDLAASYDGGNSTSRQPKMGTSSVSGVAVVGGAEPMTNNNNNNNNNNTSLMVRSRSSIRYRECLKNHAVGIGGHAVDGCGEFMPAGDEGTLDALKCAACNCHRNFHRKETSEAGDSSTPFPHHHHHLHHNNNHHQFTPQFYRPPAAYLTMGGSGVGVGGGHSHHHQQHRVVPPTPLALPSTSGGGQSREDQDDDVSNPSGGGGGGGGGGMSGSSSKKRFRTKFTPEQKDKMLGLAERLGWRIQKHDEGVVQQFCNETGVKRHVLKVWMHNNKLTLGAASSGPGASPGVGAAVVASSVPTTSPLAVKGFSADIQQCDECMTEISSSLNMT